MTNETKVFESATTVFAEKEAIRRYESGEKLMFSTGICESLTCGYGNLDDNGYWEFPLYPVERYINLAGEV